MKEVWKPVPELAGYEASSLGSIRHNGKVLKPQWQGHMYHVTLTCRPPFFLEPRGHKPGSRPRVSAARLVCAAFHKRPESFNWTPGYRDNDRRNLTAKNLFWCIWEGAPSHGWGRLDAKD